MLADGKLLALVGTPAQVAEALLGIGIYGASPQLQQQWQPQEAQEGGALPSVLRVDLATLEAQ